MRPLPIRIRLTLWYFAMFASAATLLCAASFWMLDQCVNLSEYHELQERAEDVQDALNHADATWSSQQLGDELAALYILKDDGKYLQVRDDRGLWLFRSKRMAAENPALPDPASLPSAGIQQDFRQGTRFVRVLAYPITVRGRRYAVETGMALNKPMALVAQFRARLLLLTPIVLVVAAVAGHLMSRKALEPVAVLAAEARRINDRNLDLRLPEPAARDEIRDLSCTLNQMLERIDKAFASVRIFTGNASHELRTPIALLRTEIEVALLRPRDGAQYRAILGRLHEQTVRMTSLVENLLSLARADGGAETISVAPIRVSDLFHRMEGTWRSAMDQALLDFEVEASGSDLVALGDAQGISRMLSILLENACKYTAPGGMVKLRACADGDRVAFSVTDSGVGIAPEHEVRIFDRFYRAPSPLEDPPAGSGLGLAIAKWIAERHGTDLRVSSKPGTGSCFFFSLRSAMAALLGNPAQARQGQESMAEPNPQSGEWSRLAS